MNFEVVLEITRAGPVWIYIAALDSRGAYPPTLGGNELVTRALVGDEEFMSSFEKLWHRDERSGIAWEGMYFQM